MTEFNDRSVLITGAGGGFGQELTAQFRAAGARLLLTDIDDRQLRNAIDLAGDSLVASATADLATVEGCGDIAGVCTAYDIVPDILVNNAGIGIGGRLDNVPRERWETLMQLNLMAPMRLTNLFLPAMVERGSGHIVNISSLAGWVGSQGLTAYCASKFGLRGFGESLAVDQYGTGVNVTNIYPCFTRTPILDSPQYGYDEQRVVPEWLISEPADVVAKMLKGIEKDKLHVFPDRHARRIHYLSRFAPWVIPLLNRRMESDAIAAGKEAR